MSMKKKNGSQDGNDDSGTRSLNGTAKVAGSLTKSMLLASELGLWLSLPIVGGAFLGHYLDQKFSSTPFATLLFIFLGVVIVFLKLYSFVKNAENS